METVIIPARNGNEVRVNECSIRTVIGDPENYDGCTGTLYNGDAELISDFLADPNGELDIYGILHHIHLTYADDVFAMTITSVEAFGQVEFSHSEARDIIFALAGAKPYRDNPKRR